MADIPTIRGGDYKAKRATDGTWSILGVPIFANCERTITTQNGMKLTAKFDRAWQEKAVSRAKAKHAESGVMRAIYPKHKSAPGESRDVLGFFLPTEVRDMDIGGKRTSVTFADYVGVSDSAYQDLKSRRHPYKSVEAPIGTEPEFTGLAWLKEPPFHDDFPIQTVSEFSSRDKAVGVVAFSNDAAAVTALVRFAMPEIDEKPDEKKPAEGVPPVAPAPGGEKPVAATPAAPGVEPEVKTNPVGELGAKVDALSSLMNVLVGLVAKLSGGSQDGPGAAPRPGAVVGAFSAGGSTVSDPAPHTVTFSAEGFASLQGENAALKSRIDKAEKAEARRNAIAGAVAKVKGYPVPEAEIVAQFDAGGSTALDAYVAATVKFGTRDPDNAAFGADTNKTVDPIVASFAGHEAAAAEFGAQFDSLPASLRGGMSREAWITTSLGYVGVAKTEATK